MNFAGTGERVVRFNPSQPHLELMQHDSIALMTGPPGQDHHHREAILAANTVAASGDTVLIISNHGKAYLKSVIGDAVPPTLHVYNQPLNLLAPVTHLTRLVELLQPKLILLTPIEGLIGSTKLYTHTAVEALLQNILDIRGNTATAIVIATDDTPANLLTQMINQIVSVEATESPQEVIDLRKPPSHQKSRRRPRNVS